MSNHRITHPALGAALASALLLTACANDDNTTAEDVPGTDQGDEATDETETPENDEASSPDGAPEAPHFDLPDDLTIVIDDDFTGEEATDTLLRDHGYALTAMLESYTQQQPTDNFGKYWRNPAYTSYVPDFEVFGDENRTIAGTGRFYKREVDMGSDRGVVTFCEDTTDAYGKDLESNERIDFGDADSKEAFRSYRHELEWDDDGFWAVHYSTWSDGSEECEAASE